MSELKQILTNISEEKNTKIIPENIKVGVNVFNVEGTFTSDATATASDIKEGKIAYSNGERLIGTMPAGFDTSIMTSVDGIFSGNTNIVELPSLEFSSCVNIYRMANNCTSLKTVGDLKFPNALNITSSYNSGMFYGCSAIEKIGNLEITRVHTAGLTGTCMFYKLQTLKEIGNISFPYIKNAQGFFYNCYQLDKIGTLDFSGGLLTNIQEMFFGCLVLEYIPIFDTSKVITTSNAFKACDNLNDEALNNILYMLTNSEATTKYEGNAYVKALSYVGLTQNQATRCQSLSNYQAFLDAGWTTGY